MVYVLSLIIILLTVFMGLSRCQAFSSSALSLPSSDNFVDLTTTTGTLATFSAVRRRSLHLAFDCGSSSSVCKSNSGTKTTTTRTFSAYKILDYIGIKTTTFLREQRCVGQGTITMFPRTLSFNKSNRGPGSEIRLAAREEQASGEVPIEELHRQAMEEDAEWYREFVSKYNPSVSVAEITDSSAADGTATSTDSQDSTPKILPQRPQSMTEVVSETRGKKEGEGVGGEGFDSASAVIKDVEERVALSGLGYTLPDISRMSAEVRERVISNEIWNPSSDEEGVIAAEPHCDFGIGNANDDVDEENERETGGQRTAARGEELLQSRASMGSSRVREIGDALMRGIEKRAEVDAENGSALSREGRQQSRRLTTPTSRRDDKGGEYVNTSPDGGATALRPPRPGEVDPLLAEDDMDNSDGDGESLSNGGQRRRSRGEKSAGSRLDSTDASRRRPQRTTTRGDGNERRQQKFVERDSGSSSTDDNDDEYLPGTKFWMGLDPFRDYLKKEAYVRALVVPPQFRPLLKKEGRWRYHLYKNWLRALKYGVGDEPPIVTAMDDDRLNSSLSSIRRTRRQTERELRGAKRGKRARSSPRRRITAEERPPSVSRGAREATRKRGNVERRKRIETTSPRHRSDGFDDYDENDFFSASAVAGDESRYDRTSDDVVEDDTGERKIRERRYSYEGDDGDGAGRRLRRRQITTPTEDSYSYAGGSGVGEGDKGEEEAGRARHGRREFRMRRSRRDDLDD